MSTSWREVQFPGMARHTDPDTSHTAPQADPLEGRELALSWHARFPSGLTDFQLAEHTGRLQTSIGKRRGELVTLGYITRVIDPDTGKPVRGTSPSGSSCAVWRITAEGQRAHGAGTPLNLPKP